MQVPMELLRRLILGVAALGLACQAERAVRPPDEGPTSLVLIHTADLHSHLFPERTTLSFADAARGLGPAREVSAVGGFARVASIVSAIRAGAEHSLYLDSGDVIEGSAAFTEFGGEPELRAYSAVSVGAVALGNHDLDPGVSAFTDMHRRFARFPVLAANFADNGSELAAELVPSVVLDAQGLKVGVIGVANPSSPPGLGEADNPYGVRLLPTARAVQSEIDRLRAAVDVIVLISHLGLNGDESLVQSTSGLDVVLGGHQHLTLDSALERADCGPALQMERACQPRRVIIAHSGALGHYVGQIALSLQREADGHAEPGLEVVAASQSLVPVSATVAEDPSVAALLEPYRASLHAAGYDTPLAFAVSQVERDAANGGASALGNLIADAIRARTGADLVLLNSTGIRASLPPGELDRAAFIAALPFADTLAALAISGAQLRALLNQQARVASDRGCQTPIQISGLTLELKCSGTGSTARASLAPSGRALDSQATYVLVTTTYLAKGGSGFELLAPLSRSAVEADPLQVVLDAVAGLPNCAQSALPCVDPLSLRDGRIVMTPG